WEEYLEEAEHLRHTTYNKSIYALRSQTIERVFADLKEKHGLRYTTLRGIDKVRMQTLLAFACLNLKKLANWKWKNSKNQLIFSIFLSIKYVFSKLRDKSYARLKICPFGQIVLSTNWNLDNYLSSFFVVD
ncbi:Transposase DDE domain-containing protein, partial [Alkalithermobacter thermoalcaliphilus JW-YL-7 = DSM 7308]